MAIEYELAVRTPQTAAEVANRVARVGHATGLLGGGTTSDDLLGGVATNRGTWVHVRDDIPMPGPAERSFGFVPTVVVRFRPTKAVPHHLQEDDVVRLVAALLDQIAGDLILYRDSDDAVWLLRRDGELTVHASPEIWPPHRLALLTPPYRRATRAF